MLVIKKFGNRIIAEDNDQWQKKSATLYEVALFYIFLPGELF